jgi:hypothetical protein
MKTIKLFAVSALVCAGIGGLFVACQRDAVDTTLSTDKVGSDNAMMELVELGEKINPAESELESFEARFERLSMDELVQYRQAQHLKIKLEVGDSKSVNEVLNNDLLWWKQIHNQSVAKFGKPANQISPAQRDELFKATHQQNAKNGKVTACPAITFNTSFTRGNGGSTNLSPTNAREVDPGGSGDCDCQMTFGTSNSNFRRLRPLTGTAGTLLNDFGGTLGGRQLTGASAGSYPVWGKGRVTFRYPSAAFNGCNVLLNQYTLSNQ